MPAILKAAAEAGATFAAYTLLRLPYAVKDVFLQWLEQQFPERKDKVLSRIREFREGKLTDSRFEYRGRGEGQWAELLRDMFHLHRARVGIQPHGPRLSTAAFRRPGLAQGSLF
jgi:DNA repair photolyase